MIPQTCAQSTRRKSSTHDLCVRLIASRIDRNSFGSQTISLGSAMNTNPYNSSAASMIGTCNATRNSGAPHVKIGVLSRFTATVVAVGVWQTVSLVMMFAYRHVIGHLVVAAYTASDGDIQASYGRFERVGTYIALVVITLPASILTIVLYNKLSGLLTNRKRMIFTVCVWQMIVLAVLTWSYELGFPYMINQLGWRLFGPPTEIYSFMNLVLHRIIAWLLCTMPVSWAAVWIYSRWYDADLALANSATEAAERAHTAEKLRL